MPAATTPEAERERRARISAKLSGRTLSEETRRRMSESAIHRSLAVLVERARAGDRTPSIDDLEQRA
jgi:hypothetical protein